MARSLLGDIVLAPVGDKSSEVAFEAMTRPDGQPAESCSDPANAPFCIVARRQLHFSAHEELAVRIDLRLACLGKVCTADQTCVRGTCVGATLTSCEGACDENGLLPAGATPPPGAPDAGGDAADTGLPVPVLPPSFLSPIAAGAAHTCVITKAGGVKCWGDNGRGELGNNTFTESHVPVVVQGVSNAISVSAGLYFTCALIADGSVKCWGKNDYGELGINTATDSPLPVTVKNLANAVSLANGCKHACATTRLGELRCWGWNSHGQLGNDSVANQGLPVAPTFPGPGFPHASFVTAGFEFTCAVFGDGIKCWGDNSNGQLGNGGTMDSHVPVASTALAFVPSILSAGAAHVLAVGTTGGTHIASWGLNPGTGGLADALDSATAGEGYNCALRNGGVLCWGSNGYGQLGNGATMPAVSAVVPTGLGSGVRAIRTGYEHACAIMADDRVRCWGRNTNGQLGNNSTTDSHVPVDVVVN